MKLGDGLTIGGIVAYARRPLRTRKAPPPPGLPTSNTYPGVEQPSRFLRTLVVVLALCAIAEGFVIARLVQRRWATPSIAPIELQTQNPGASVLVDGQPAGVTPLRLQIKPGTRSISVVSAAPQAPAPEPVGITGQQNSARDKESQPPVAGVKPGGPLAVASPPPQRSGGIRLISPIVLEVFDGDRRLGSSATGIVSASAGRHQLDLVNSALGYRTRRVVDIKGGQVVSLAVSPPDGLININAVPWAEVWIDGRSIGETPIGNLAIPLGEHEILFRHPQLGEQRRTVVVRLDGATRVSVNLQRQPSPH